MRATYLGKRTFDLIVSLVFIGLLVPVLVVLACLVAHFLGRPILFVQRRAGLKGVPFCIYKFRTMTEAKDASGVLLPAERRLTSFGRFLRSTSLDELPQLINVIKGELSLVGPRPLHLEYVPLYNDEQALRLNAKPGITGHAQLNGRNSLSWEERFELDIWYVRNISPALDTKILFETFLKILKRESVSPTSGEIMLRFKGTKRKIN